MKLFSHINKSIPIALGIIILLVLNPTFAQGTGDGLPTCPGDGVNFVDEDGDGFNDNARDADGDGVPNGMDDDYVRPNDGSRGGFHANNENRTQGFGHGYRQGNSGWRGNGMGDGADNRNTPQDGSGYGHRDGSGNHNGRNQQRLNGNK